MAQFHAYEGYPLDAVVYPIRLMAALGVQDIISTSHAFSISLLKLIDGMTVTNAAGSLRADVPVGTSAPILTFPHKSLSPSSYLTL